MTLDAVAGAAWMVPSGWHSGGRGGPTPAHPDSSGATLLVTRKPVQWIGQFDIKGRPEDNQDDAVNE
jgi:hypothetical protein